MYAVHLPIPALDILIFKVGFIAFWLDAVCDDMVTHVDDVSELSRGHVNMSTQSCESWQY